MNGWIVLELGMGDRRLRNAQQVLAPDEGYEVLQERDDEFLALGVGGGGHVEGVDHQSGAVHVQDPEPVDLPGTLVIAVLGVSPGPALEVVLGAVRVVLREVDISGHAPLEVAAGATVEHHVYRLAGVPQRDVHQRIGKVIDARTGIGQRSLPLARMPVDLADVPELDGHRGFVERPPVE